MYGKSTLDSLNGNTSSATQEPIQLSATEVSNGIVLASRNSQDLPRVGLTAPEGFVTEGDPVKIQLHSDIEGIDDLTLSAAREHLSTRYEADPSLYYGLANRGADWGHLQAYRKI